MFLELLDPTTSSQHELLAGRGSCPPINGIGGNIFRTHNSFDTISHHYSKWPYLPPTLAIPLSSNMASIDGGAEPAKRDIKNHLLFEIATEVANRGSLRTPCHSRAVKLTYAVGGIYSVLKSKAPVTTAEYGERYCLIGPLNRASVSHPTPEIGSTCPN